MPGFWVGGFGRLPVSLLPDPAPLPAGSRHACGSRREVLHTVIGRATPRKTRGGLEAHAPGPHTVVLPHTVSGPAAGSGFLVSLARAQFESCGMRPAAFGFSKLEIW